MRECWYSKLPGHKYDKRYSYNNSKCDKASIVH